MSTRSRHVPTTHEVTNQPFPLENYDAYALDQALREGVEREGSLWAVEKVSAYGKIVGQAETLALGARANQHPPVLRTHDRYGYRIDEVEYDPAYHELMRIAMAHGVHSYAWCGHAAGHVTHAALLYLHTQAEAGTSCPLTMTHASVASLRIDPQLCGEWEPRILAAEYDPRPLPAAQKKSVTFGMAMTEKQGGSDVRANTTRARTLSRRGSGEPYELTGHKWFCSAPMSDAFLTLAQADGGLSCFLVPRFLPDGTRNRIFIQRLKDKLGNRSNASSEIEYDRTYALLVGEEGRGVPTIIQMVMQTRVDCAAGSAALMRQALIEAIHHTRQRAAFGRLLSEQPLMQRVLADLALDAEAALALTLRVARSYDLAKDPTERAFARVATAITKYWVTRRAPNFVFEAMECLGGAGYVEESYLPRLYRESPLNSIWEGSGNVQCLDVLRALRREDEAREALFMELRRASGQNPRYDAELARVEREMEGLAEPEIFARKLVEDLALLLSASLLLRHAPSFVADNYVAARLGEARGLTYGALSSDADVKAILERAWPTA